MQSNVAEQKLIACLLPHRIGTCSGHSGPIIQLLNLGNVLLSLGSDRRLIVWEDGVYDVPKVTYHCAAATQDNGTRTLHDRLVSCRLSCSFWHVKTCTDISNKHTQASMHLCSIYVVILHARNRLPHAGRRALHVPSCMYCARLRKSSQAESGCLQTVLQLPEGFTPTCMAHPDTYLNKVVVGSQEGKLQLWNFASGKMLFEFQGFATGAIQCIAPSPALDVAGIGLSGG